MTGEIPGRQGRALLAYLVLHRDRPVSRDELIEALWPGRLPRDPDAGLSSVLARLRRAIGHEAIAGRAQLGIRLDPDAEIDVVTAACRADAAEAALETGDAERALAESAAGLEIASRPLLPDLLAPWAETRRREVRDLQPRLLEVRAAAAMRLGGPQLAAAESAARTLTTEHPYRESGYALLMEAQARRGNVAEAMWTFERLRGLLRDELGTAPSAEVSALHDRLLHGTPLDSPAPVARPAGMSPPAPPPASGEVSLQHVAGAGVMSAFVGREDELAWLRGVWPARPGPQPTLVVVHGEAGIGKSWLAARFAAEKQRDGSLVLYGRCEEEAIVPYQPFLEALRQGLQQVPQRPDPGLAAELGALARLLPEARALAGATPPAVRDPERERYELFEAVRRLLVTWAAERPVLLVIDDLHWADKPTLLMLRHVSRRQDPRILAILATLRSDEARQNAGLAKILDHLVREPGLHRIGLRGLAEPDAAALARHRLKGPQPPGFVRSLHADTGGNPLFMSEILRALRDTGAVASGVASPDALERMGVPEDVLQVIGARLTRLEPLTRRVLTVASVVGREFDLAVVAATVDVPAETVMAALDEADDAGLVVEVHDGVDRYAFCHVLVRRALYQRLSRSRQAHLHLQVGHELERMEREEDRAVDPAELARHFRLARPLPGYERVVVHAERAGAEAARALAYEEAEAHYRAALEAWGGAGRTEAARCELLLALGRVCSRAGASQRAREAFEQAVESARRRGAPDHLAQAALGLGERYWEANLADQRYSRLLAEALEALEARADPDDTLLARVLARLAANLHFTAHQRRGIAYSARAVTIARGLPGRKDLVFALLARHVALLHIARVEERLDIINEVLVLSGGWREMSAEAHHWWLYDLCELRQMDEARAAHAELLALAEELRQPLFQHVAVAWQGVFALLDGDVAEAERLAAESYVLGARAQASDAESVRAGKLFMLRRWQGRIDELLPAVRALGEAPTALTPWRAALALVRLESGDRARGRAGFDALATDGFDRVPPDFFWLATVALLAEACVALGDPAPAAALYEKLLPYADRVVQVSFAACWGSVERYLGLLAATTGDLTAADAHLGRALAANRTLASPPLVAVTAHDHARLLRGVPGGRDRAGALAAEAEALAARHGLAALQRSAAALRD